MNPPAPSVPPPLAHRVLHTLARLGLAAIIAFFAVLVFLVFSKTAQDALSNLLPWGDVEKQHPRLLVGLAVGAVFLTGALVWLGRRWSWRALAITAAAVTPVLIYLHVDEATLHRPEKVEDFSPVFPGAAAGHEVLMRYGKLHPGAQNFPGSRLAWVGYDPEKPAPWLKFVADHRAEIEAEWQGKLMPVRAWWTELNTFERIGDLTPPGLGSEILAFVPVRELSQRACAVAALRALDGHGDEAMEIVLPLLEVSRKLQPSARTLVRFMIALIVERMAMQTATLVLERTPVSPALRARLAAALAGPGGGETGARRMIAMEYVLTANDVTSRSLSGPGGPLAEVPLFQQVMAIVEPFTYNPRATLNLYADLTTDLEEIVGRRQLDKLAARDERFHSEEGRPRFKNMAGALFLRQAIPAHQKISTTFWKVQDERAALLARVRTP